MMQVIVDGEPLTGAGSTLSSALDAVRASLGPRMVIEALADGDPIPASHFDEPPDTDPYAETLEIRTEHAAALVRYSLLEAADALERIRPAHERAGELLQTGDTQACMDQLGPIFEVWGAAAQTLNIARQLEQVVLPDAAPDGRPLGTVADGLNKLLVEVKRCLAEEDVASLADVLAYDMPAAADDWVSMLRALAGTVESRGSNRVS